MPSIHMVVFLIIFCENCCKNSRAQLQASELHVNDEYYPNFNDVAILFIV